MISTLMITMLYLLQLHINPFSEWHFGGGIDVLWKLFLVLYNLVACKSLNVSLGVILICTHSSIAVIRAVFSVDVFIFAVILSASSVF